jgi:UDP-GlcNAc3NAcA epimerase
MYDAALHFADRAREKSQVLQALGLTPKGFLLTTLHRPYNVDEPLRLQAILRALGRAELPVVLPCHPRLRLRLRELGIAAPANVRIIDPVGYLDMITLEQHARMILTDSGGVQKEAYFYGIPCVTLRPETEWMTTVEAGWNRLADADESAIVAAMQNGGWPTERPQLFGDGHAAERIVEVLRAALGTAVSASQR